MVLAIVAISYNKNIICNAKYIWLILKYFIYFSLKPISCRGCSKWSFISVPAKVAFRCCEVWWSLVSLRLWYLEHASIRERCFTLFNFGKILNVGPLWSGLISMWFSLHGNRHSLIFPLGLSTSTMLLHHTIVSSMPSVDLWRTFMVHRLSILGAPGMFCCLVLPAVKMFHQSILFHINIFKISLQLFCYFSAHSLFITWLGTGRK